MTQKWEVVVYSEVGRLAFNTEEEADREAEYQNRVNEAQCQVWPIEVEDGDDVLADE